MYQFLDFSGRGIKSRRDCPHKAPHGDSFPVKPFRFRSYPREVEYDGFVTVHGVSHDR
jgi:hypothetical protein